MCALGYMYKIINCNTIYDKQMSINKGQINCGIVIQWKTLKQ